MFFKKDQGGQRRKGLEKSSSDFFLLWFVVMSVPPGWSSAWSRAHLLWKGDSVLNTDKQWQNGTVCLSACLSVKAELWLLLSVSVSKSSCLTAAAASVSGTRAAQLTQKRWASLWAGRGMITTELTQKTQGKGARMRKMVVMFRDENLAFSLTGDISLVGNNPVSLPEDHWNYLFCIIIYCTATSSLLQNHLKGCMYELKFILLLWNSSIET